VQRVHRKLSREEVESLRKELAQLVPAAHSNIPRLLRTMRLITRKSQGEYAKLCGVSPRVERVLAETHKSASALVRRR
jgi:hypothetical protein